MKEGRGKVGRSFAEVAERVREAGLVVEAVESEKVEEREREREMLLPPTP